MKTLIIGGGMSGLTYGIMAAKNGIDTVICERNSRVGKKIAVTGNGKCNVGNVRLSAEYFNDSKIAKAVLENVPSERYRAFLKSCGIFTYVDDAGRLYPLSESASNVVDCLRHTYLKYGGKIVTDCEVTALRGERGHFCVIADGREQRFDNVVLACGSGSSVAQPNVLQLLDPKWLTKRAPSLVPVKISNMDRQLNGLRAKAIVTLEQDGRAVASERGEVQFKDYGLSGISVFNLSSKIARNIVLGKAGSYKFVVDLVPALTVEELSSVLRQRFDDDKDALFFGVLHNKIAETVLRRSNDFSPEGIASCAKGLEFAFDRLLDFSMSQVTSGGISEKYLDARTLQLPNGVVAIGEILDVDGICGGYNLYFAAASAIYLFDDEQQNRVFGKQ